MVIPAEETATPPVIGMNILTQSIDNFSGGDEAAVRQYIDAVTNASIVGKWTDDQTLAIAKIKLRDEASAFIRLKGSKITTWKQLCEELEKRFAKSEPELTILQRFLACTQLPNESVAKYAQRLEGYLVKILHPSNNAEKDAEALAKFTPTLISQFIKGLRSDIRRSVFSRDPKTYEDAFKFAQHEETSALLLCSSDAADMRINLVGGNTPQPSGARPDRPRDASPRRSGDRTVECFNCRGNHYARDCPNESGLRPPIECFRCKGDHLSRDCTMAMTCTRCGKRNHHADFCRGPPRQARGSSSSSRSQNHPNENGARLRR